MNKKEQNVKNILEKEISNARTPSVQYIIFDQKGIIQKEKMGFSDIENGVEANNETKFNFFSITKTFTALAILQLAEKGKVNIEYPASGYLPYFPYSKKITVKQLLTHTGGLPNPIPLGWVHTKSEHPSFDEKKFFSGIFKKNKKTRSEPNERFSYSNLGYVLLGQIIENVSGVSYKKYIETNIIGKIGLENELGFEIDNKHATGYQKKWSFVNLILGLFIDKSKFIKRSVGGWSSFEEYYVNGTSYGGLVGTVNSLVVYLQELLKPNNRLISEKYKTLLFTENITNNNKPTGMCLSWFKGKLGESNYYTHAGGGGGYYSEIRVYPELGVGSVVVFNRTGIKDERYLNKPDRQYKTLFKNA